MKNSSQPAGRKSIVTVREAKVYVFREIFQIWDYRYFFTTLVRRELKARYRHTTLGILWFVLQPFILMLLISLGMYTSFGTNLGGLPYPLYVASGIILWLYFTNAFNGGAGSLESFKGIMGKIAFPRMCLPLVPAITALVDMCAASLLLICMMIYYHSIPTWRIVFLPFVLLATVMFVYGLSLFLSAASTRFKDLRQIIPFIPQLFIFATPVFITHGNLGPKTEFFFEINPFSTYLDTLRWAIFPGLAHPPLTTCAGAVGGTILIFFIGLLYFQRQQSTIIDVL